MKLDTDKKGLGAIFRSWQVPLVEELFNRKFTSGEAHKFLKERDVWTGSKKSHTSVSRASVINFLNSLVDQELIGYTMRTGKGGHHRVYKMLLTREELAHKLIGLFVNKLLEVFPEDSKTFTWPQP